MKVSAEFVSTVTEILEIIAGQCDGATTRDGTGFNRDDLRAGVHDLIEYLQTESPREMREETVKWLLFMAVFYQRQWVKRMPADTLPRIKRMTNLLRG